MFRPDGTGEQLLTAKLLPHLRARGVEVTILSGGGKGLAGKESHAGTAVRRSVVPGYSVVATLGFTLSALVQALRRRNGFDLVHVFGATNATLINLVARVVRRPVLVKVTRSGTLGDLTVLAKRKGGRRMLRALASRCWFMAQNSAVRDDILNAGVPHERVFDIPNGIDTTAFTPVEVEDKETLRAGLGLPLGVPLAVYTGRLVHVKRVDTVIRALGSIPELHLLVAGQGDRRRALEMLAAELGVSERVWWQGFTHDVASCLGAADLFVLPSESEGLAQSLLEAMACGLPWVTTPIVAVGELDHAGGTVCPVGDVEAWTPAMARLAGDEALRAERGRAARARAEAFTLESSADFLVDAYRAMLAST